MILTLTLPSSAQTTQSEVTTLINTNLATNGVRAITATKLREVFSGLLSYTDYLAKKDSLKTINGTSLIGTGDISISGGGLTDGDKGDITVGGSGTTLAIDNGAVSNAKLANVATSTIKGRSTAGTGAVEDLTASQVRTIINVADGATANDTDANLKNRANHTGTQAASTISDFDTEVSNNTDVAANTAKVSFPEAPNDGQEYVRKNLAWAVATAGGGGASTSSANTWTAIQTFTDSVRLSIIKANTTGGITFSSSTGTAWGKWHNTGRLSIGSTTDDGTSMLYVNGVTRVNNTLYTNKLAPNQYGNIELADAGNNTFGLIGYTTNYQTLKIVFGNDYSSIPSAAVRISSTTQGFLPPRMTATQASAISSPAEGLMLYVTDTNGTFTTKGWWGWEGTQWQKLNN